MSFHFRIPLAALALMLVAGIGNAQTAPANQTQSSSTKIGIIAIQQAIAATNEGKKDLEALQQRFAPKQAEIKSMSDEVENLKKQLQTQSDKLSDDARATQVRTLDTKQKLLQRTYDDAQGEYQQAQQEIVNRIGTKMVKVLEQYAKKNGYAVILDVSNPQTPVLYASETTNVTKEIVDAYNAQSAPATHAAKPASAPGSAAAAGKTGAASTAAKRP